MRLGEAKGLAWVPRQSECILGTQSSVKALCCLLAMAVERAVGGTSLAVQWLGLHALTAESTGSIPGQGTKTPQAGHGMDFLTQGRAPPPPAVQFCIVSGLPAARSRKIFKTTLFFPFCRPSQRAPGQEGSAAWVPPPAEPSPAL